VGGGSSVSRLVPGYRSFQSGALLGRQGAEPAADALVQENERARQFGFGDAELERSKKDMLRNVEKAFAEREKTDSARYAGEYLRNFLERETIPGIENELSYIRVLLPTIGLADVNAFARSVIPEKAAKLVIYTGTDKPDSGTPTEPKLLGAVAAAELKGVNAKVEKAVATSLMANLPAGGSVVAERKNAALGVTEWDLSNGVKVILKPTDFKNDEIVLSANRFGGQSLFGQADMYNAGYGSSAIASMGLGEFTPTELQKMMAGKVASVSTGLGAHTDVVSATSSPADLETMLQLLTLKFGSPRLDPALFQSFVSRSQDAARNATARPESVFSDAMQTTLFNNHPRVWLTPRPVNFDQLSVERIRAIYQERFASAKGMTFVLVGSFTPDGIKPLVAKYLGSLPTPDIPAAYADLGLRPVTGVVKKDVRAGSEPKSVVSITFSGPAAYSEEEQLRMRALVEVINIKIIDVLREKLTLIYGGGMGGGLNRDPYAHFMVGMSLPCAPENVDKVVAAAFGEILKIQEGGPEASDLAKVKQNWLTQHRQDLRENRYWLGKLQTAELYKTDPATLLDYEKQVAAIAADDVKAAAHRYLKRDNYVQVVLYPELK
jgi:zinc protease